MIETVRRRAAQLLGVALPLLVLAEVNRPHLSPQTQLALFAGGSLALCFLRRRRAPRRATTDEGGAPLAEERLSGESGDGEPAAEPRPGVGRGALDLALALASLLVCGWVAVQSEPLTARWWIDGASLGDRAGAEGALDVAVGLAGLALVLEATRRALGLALPLLAVAFLAYARLGALLPDFLLPHRGHDLERIVSQTFLHSQGVFGIALQVMFAYVFLFVVFGALLEASGATGFVLGLARRLLGRTAGGPAKVAVVASGLMGSLSGSAVANTATTGTFTIPMMRSAGFSRAGAAGIEAAASSGGALVPPVMGAGAYMMLEIVQPPVTYLEIIRAALIPALLYYLALFLGVHFRARRILARDPAAAAAGGAGKDGPGEDGAGGDGAGGDGPGNGAVGLPQGLVFGAGLGVLVVLLLQGASVFRAVSWAMLGVLAVAAVSPRTRLGPRTVLRSLVSASRDAVPLSAAAAAVGIVIGVVTLTGAGTRIPSLLLPLAENHLGAALALLMVSSLVLGMGLPSAVCYLLLATLVGPVLGDLGVVPLAAHLFIFYFGMMSMVTPPVALAAYAASSIARAPFGPASMAAFRYALAGFALPYLFVYRPQLLLLDPGGGPAAAVEVAVATAVAVAGVVPLAAGLAGQLAAPLGLAGRGLLLAAAGLTLLPVSGPVLGRGDVSVLNLAGMALFAVVLGWQVRRGRRSGPSA